MKYLAIFVLISSAFAQINSIVNNKIKLSLRKTDEITSSSIENNLPDAPTVTSQEITSSVHPELTTTIITPMSSTAITTIVHPVTTVITNPHVPLTQEVSTLIELPIDYHTSISYYYPYFYKTHLISFADDIDTSILVKTCSAHCSYCDADHFDHCLRCDIGFFLSGFGCESICPDGYITDILRLKCVPLLTTGILQFNFSNRSCFHKGLFLWKLYEHVRKGSI